MKILQALPNTSGKLKIIDKKTKTVPEFLSSFSGTIGIIDEKHSGPFAKEYNDALKKYKTTDIKLAFEDVLSYKEPEEVQLVKSSSQYTAKIFRKAVTSMESIIDEGKEIKHVDFAKQIESIVSKAAGEMDLTVAFSPIVQSGGKYNLSLDYNDFSLQSDSNTLKFDNIIIMFGLRYRSYCSFVARTYLIDATREKEQNYEILNSVYDFLIKKKIKVGTTLDSVYIAAREFLKKRKPELLPHLITKVGFGIGIQPYSKTLEIAEGNSMEIADNMTLVVQLGLENVPDTNNKASYTMYIADTVVVSTSDYSKEERQQQDVIEMQQDCQLLTKVKIEYGQISYAIEDTDAVEEVEPQDIDQEFGERKRRNAAIASGLIRGVQSESSGSSNLTEEERRKRQLALLQKKREEYAGNEGSSSASSRKKKLSTDEKFARGDVVSYTQGFIPKNVPTPTNQIIIDKKQHTVLLPINGTHVPFHIASIKNISKSDEGEYIHLRINFNNSKQNFGKVYEAAKKFKDHVFIKEISYRAKDSKKLESAMREILELRKQIGQEERDREYNESNKEVEQPKLKLVSKGQKAPRLADIFMRPGKKQVGVIEAHENGLKFSSNKGAKIEILYSNIKHAFFQEAKNDIIVLIHFHLKQPVMIGKKTYHDIQFFTEVLEEFDHLVGKNRRQAVSEREAIEEEARERLLKQKLNKEFAAFVKKVEEKSGIEFEIPYRDLEFTGAPSTGKSNVTLVPTVNCLVSLSEAPFFVLTLDEVEIANFERMKFGLKGFDLVFVMKDLTTYYTILHIPMEKVDTLKDWLTNINVLFFEGSQSLKWPQILKTIREDPTWEPYGEGGWTSFLIMSGDENNDDEEGEMEDADEYQPSSAEEEEHEDEEDEDMYIDSDDDEDFEDDEEEEDAPTWEELENEALEEDNQKRKRDEELSDEEDYRKPTKKNKKPTKK